MKECHKSERFVAAAKADCGCLPGDPEMRSDNLIDFAHLLCYTFLVTINMRRDWESG